MVTLGVRISQYPYGICKEELKEYVTLPIAIGNVDERMLMSEDVLPNNEARPAAIETWDKSIEARAYQVCA